MQSGTPFATDLPKYGRIAPNTAKQRRSGFESPRSSSAPNSVPNATLTSKTGSLSLAEEQTSACFMFLPVQFGDLVVSALVDFGAMHNFFEASLLPKLRGSASFVSIVPWKLQVTLADRVWCRQFCWLLRSQRWWMTRK